METGANLMDSVFIDEAGFNLHLTRRFGRARRGERAVRVRPTQRGRNVSVVVAVGREGIIASEVRLGAFNTDRFNTFLADTLLPNLHGPRTIIMDNVPFHKSHEVQDTIENAGHICEYLPPYSPQLNAAEWVFGNIKTHVRRQDLDNQETLCAHINNGIRRITPEMTMGWIREVNRNFVAANRGEDLGRLYT
jgi:transposase